MNFLGREVTLVSSTHERSPACPPRPSYARGYVWPLYEGYEIYRAEQDGSSLTPLTRSPGYDAEATIAPDGLIVFTSVRDGDMEIYSMNGDGSDVRRLTNRPGPDGGWVRAGGAFGTGPLHLGRVLAQDIVEALRQLGGHRHAMLQSESQSAGRSLLSWTNR